MKNEHKEILDKLAELCEKYPEYRFGQILFNHTMIGKQDDVGYVLDPFHYSDKDFINSIKI